MVRVALFLLAGILQQKVAQASDWSTTSQPDSEVPQKPPPFPYTQVVWAMGIILLAVTIFGCCCYCRGKKSPHQAQEQGQLSATESFEASASESAAGPSFAGQPPVAHEMQTGIAGTETLQV
eukprot:TRINITY_DN27230_c0_g1_i1.p1 TRINITY_DN27230_c0_g1~~TRINITY_DN27230_c0_g1_i1.p1  ORF type:complete len:122 (-),score=18.22 TRINITY_DN27230_c0_g1_i1:512-877(-)